MSVLLFAKSFEAQKGHKEARDFSLLRKRAPWNPASGRKGISRPASIFIRRRQEKAWN